MGIMKCRQKRGISFIIIDRLSTQYKHIMS